MTVEATISGQVYQVLFHGLELTQAAAVTRTVR
jgi:hypothetical protein